MFNPNEKSASPPVEQPVSTINTYAESPEEIRQKPVFIPAASSLEGEHWSDVESGLRPLTFKGQQINKCLLDLRSEFRRLVEAMKDAK